MNTIDPKVNEIRRLRISKGHSIRGLANISSLNPATVHKIENGKSNPSPATAHKLCNALGVNFEDLFKIKNNE